MACGSGDEWITVVGVVGDVSTGVSRARSSRRFIGHSCRRQPATCHWSYARPGIRGARDEFPQRRGVHRCHRACQQIRTVEQILSSSVATSRFTTLRLPRLPPWRLTLAAIGIYGVPYRSTGAPARSVRMALGAGVGRPADGAGARLLLASGDR